MRQNVDTMGQKVDIALKTFRFEAVKFFDARCYNEVIVSSRLLSDVM